MSTLAQPHNIVAFGFTRRVDRVMGPRGSLLGMIQHGLRGFADRLTKEDVRSVYPLIRLV